MRDKLKIIFIINMICAFMILVLFVLGVIYGT